MADWRIWWCLPKLTSSQGGVFSPSCDQVAVRLSGDPAAGHEQEQEQQQDEYSGSSDQSIPGTASAASLLMIRDMLCLN